jgi:hypothetical protein
MTIQYEAGTTAINIKELTYFYREYRVLTQNGDLFKVSHSWQCETGAYNREATALLLQHSTVKLCR